MSEGNRVSLRDYMELRFDALDETLKKDREDAKEKMGDHEHRIRSLEKRQPIRNAIEIVTGVAAAVGVALGFKQ